MQFPYSLKICTVHKKWQRFQLLKISYVQSYYVTYKMYRNIDWHCKKSKFCQILWDISRLTCQKQSTKTLFHFFQHESIETHIENFEVSILYIVAQINWKFCFMKFIAKSWVGNVNQCLNRKNTTTLWQNWLSTSVTSLPSFLCYI